MTMDLNMVLLLGNNMEHSFQVVRHNSTGTVVQYPMPLMRRGGPYNLPQQHPQFPPLLTNIYQHLLHNYRLYQATQIGVDRAAPMLHCLTPSYHPHFAKRNSHSPLISSFSVSLLPFT